MNLVELFCHLYDMEWIVDRVAETKPKSRPQFLILNS